VQRSRNDFLILLLLPSGAVIAGRRAYVLGLGVIISLKRDDTIAICFNRKNSNKMPFYCYLRSLFPLSMLKEQKKKKKEASNKRFMH
jgi:hypothetical protein